MSEILDILKKGAIDTAYGALGTMIDFGIGQAANAINSERSFEYGENAAKNAYYRQLALINGAESPAAQVERLKAAGLNPALVLNSGGLQGSGGTAPQGSGAGVQNAGVTGLLQNAVLAAQINNINANTEKQKEETNSEKLKQFGLEYDNSLKMLETQIKSTTINEQIETIKSTAEDIKNKAILSGINADIAEQTKDTEIERAKQEVNKIITEINLTKEQKEEITENINKLKRLSFGYVQGMLETILNRFIDDKEKVETLAGGLTTILIYAASRK